MNSVQIAKNQSLHPNLSTDFHIHLDLDMSFSVGSDFVYSRHNGKLNSALLSHIFFGTFTSKWNLSG